MQATNIKVTLIRWGHLGEPDCNIECTSLWYAHLLNLQGTAAVHDDAGKQAGSLLKGRRSVSNLQVSAGKSWASHKPDPVCSYLVAELLLAL
jgi:hypothetical protein